MLSTNEELVEELVSGGYLKTPHILEAFRAVDRRDFVTEEMQERAYANEPLPLGHGQTISQPLTVAFMLELLAPKLGDVILDVGAGSGYQVGLLAFIVARNFIGTDEPIIGAKILALERIPELKAFAEYNLEKYKFISRGIVELAVADASKGVPVELMPRYGFNKIIAGASGSEIPIIWKKQLAVTGRIVAPVGESIIVVDKYANDRFRTQEYPGFRFVPLVSDSE